MKTAKILLTLAALAGASVNATVVSFTGGSASTAATFTGSDSLTVATAYTYNSVAITNKWSQVLVGQDADGVGVESGNNGGSAYEVEGVWKEYIAFDFSATATGAVSVSSIVLNFPNTPSGPSYFTYQWISALPLGNTPSVPGTFTTVTSGISGSGSQNYTGITGQGRYLILGAINGSLNTSNMFAVTSITYSAVPDGASTLALMGAAVATLGLAARRRRA
jgi:hypothetical protein